jgi:hypothetical protein
MAEVLIFPAIYMGVILGLYEFFAIHKDLAFRGSHFLKHFWHSLILSMVFVFVLMNIDFVLTNFSFLQSIPFISNHIVLRVLVGLIVILKIHGAGVVARGVGVMGSIGETWAHALIITGLVEAAPFIWPLIAPLIAQNLPWLPL